MKKSILFFALASMPFFADSQITTFTSNTNAVTTPSNYSTTTYTKTVTASINPLIALPHNFTVIHIRGTRTIIEVTVSANCSPSILKALAIAERYTLDINTLTFPKMGKTIFVNGQNLDERLTVKIFVGQDAE